MRCAPPILRGCVTIEIEIELGAPSSTEEAAVFISINNIEEGFERLDL